nr:inner membrane protein YfeZ [Raoultella sp. NCTC 9187]
MKNTEFIPADFDAHGRLRLPFLFWCVLLLQARTWVLFIMAGASRQQGDVLLNLFYPDHDNFWLGLLPGIPAVLAFIVSGQRQRFSPLLAADTAGCWCSLRRCCLSGSRCCGWAASRLRP